MEEFPRDRARIRRLSPNDTKALVTELDGTVMSHLQENTQWLIRIRNWAAEEFTGMSQALAALQEDVMELRERQGVGEDDSGIDAEVLDKLVRLCGGMKAMVQLVLQKKGQKLELDAEQTKLVQEQDALADDCLKELSAFEVEGDEGEEEQDGG
jgi:hypothetical protein